MSKYKFIIFSVLVSFVIDQQCTFGVNCPYNQGFCVDTKCECIEGYWSLMDKSLTPGQQIFCNYEQINVYVPLILELLLPGTGHFYVGKYWFALIKLILLLTTLFGGYYFDKDLPIPNFICVLKDQFLTEQNLFEKKKASDLLKGGKREEKINEEANTTKDIFKKIYDKVFLIFWIVWAVDLFFYFTKVYKDGNGVPFVWINKILYNLI